MVLEARNISKAFGATHALSGADLTVGRGEVVGLVGANGAGKSTLVKILSGAISPDGGTISIGDWTGGALTPRSAQALGIATIYQDPTLVPTLGAAENVVLGREASRAGIRVDGQQMAEARELLSRVGLDPSLRTPTGAMNPAHQQLVELAKALYREARVVIMDEPTAPLGQAESQELFERIKSLSAHGVAVIYISHRLDEVLRICDRVTVMRDGRTVASHQTTGLTEEDLVREMIGHAVTPLGRRIGQRSSAALRLTGVGQGSRLRDVSLTLHQGEVLGLTGLVGSGRSRLVRVIFGIDHHDRGEMELFGAPYRPRGPHDAIARGVGLIPEDRKRDALLLSQSCAANITLARLPAAGRIWLKRGDESRIARRFMDRLQVKAPSIAAPSSQLSGGNQQKLVIGRWLHAGSRVIVFDEPGQGVDVGAKEQILTAIRELADQGAAILVVSQEVDELQQVADRVAVMRQGAIAGFVDGDDINEHRIVALSMGVSGEGNGEGPAMASVENDRRD